MKRFLWPGVCVIAACVWLGCESGSSSSQAAPTTKQSSTATPATQTSETKTVKVKVFDKSSKLVEIDSPRVVKTDEQWQKQLTPEQYKIARAKGTERPFCGTLLDNKQTGVYSCICCGLPLFSSDSKFHSGTGWPSFFQPIAEGNVIEHEDNNYGMQRTEILCARCDCHLGHVFNDGPKPTGLRFCVNSESLKFTASDKLSEIAEAPMTKGQ
jgi:methionine-R-sulfoxide reductase